MQQAVAMQVGAAEDVVLARVAGAASRRARPGRVRHHDRSTRSTAAPRRRLACLRPRILLHRSDQAFDAEVRCRRRVRRLARADPSKPGGRRWTRSAKGSAASATSAGKAQRLPAPMPWRDRRHADLDGLPAEHARPDAVVELPDLPARRTHRPVREDLPGRDGVAPPSPSSAQGSAASNTVSAAPTSTARTTSRRATGAVIRMSSMIAADDDSLRDYGKHGEHNSHGSCPGTRRSPRGRPRARKTSPAGSPRRSRPARSLHARTAGSPCADQVVLEVVAALYMEDQLPPAGSCVRLPRRRPPRWAEQFQGHRHLPTPARRPCSASSMVGAQEPERRTPRGRRGGVHFQVAGVVGVDPAGSLPLEHRPAGAAARTRSSRRRLSSASLGNPRGASARAPGRLTDRSCLSSLLIASLPERYG